jgi:hypothetical protein
MSMSHKPGCHVGFRTELQQFEGIPSNQSLLNQMNNNEFKATGLLDDPTTKRIKL